MNDPWNPSPTDIRQWAFDEDADEPDQDWVLAVSSINHERTIFELAADNSCPKQGYFLYVLYFIVGSHVRSTVMGRKVTTIDGFIDRADDYQHPMIQLWQERSRNLLKNPSEFDYDDWCEGKLANSFD